MILERKGGYEVATANNGQEGLDYLVANGDVDLVLTDHFMPVMDGLELTRRIRADSKYASLPVIMCSGGGTTCREEALVAGADNFLEKPYAAKPLLELIATYLQ